GVLGVDERGDTAAPLRVGDGVQGERGLAGALRAVDLDDPAAREAADAERGVQGDRAGRDHLDGRAGLVAEPHDGAPAELTLDLRERGLQRLLPVAATAAPGARLIAGCHCELPSDQGTPLSPSQRALSALPGHVICLRRRRYAHPPT